MAVVKTGSMLWFIGVSFLFMIQCHCLQIQLTTSPFDQGVESKELQVPVEKLLPRKLQVLAGKVTATVQENAEKYSYSKVYHPDEKNFSDKLERKKAAKPRLKQGQTWQQWRDDDGDSSEYFTMDYSRVRRRRPIHNKSLPVGP